MFSFKLTKDECLCRAARAKAKADAYESQLNRCQGTYGSWMRNLAEWRGEEAYWLARAEKAQ